MDSERYPALLARLTAAVAEPLPTGDGARPPSLVDLTGAEYRRLRKAACRAESDPTDAQLHALRIRAKRLRYTAELAAAPAGTPVRNVVKAATTMQDVLGEHQDACLARDRIVGLLAVLGDAVDLDVAFVAGRLAEREEIDRLAARHEWPAAWQLVRQAAASARLAG